MKKADWSILVVNSEVRGRVRRVPFSKAIVIVVAVFLVLGFLGLGRCIYFASSYGFAKMGRYYSIKENKKLKDHVFFFSKLTQQKTKQVDKLVSFEDNTRMRFGMDPISSDIRKVGVGGRPELNDLILSSFEDPLIRKTDSIKENVQTLLRQVRLEDTTFATMAHSVDNQIDIWAQRPAVMPVWGRFTSPFGYRVHPFTGEYIFHEGLDICNTIGTPVHSTAGGVVSFVGYKDYFGNVVMIMHPASGYKTVFAHLSKTMVVEGQAVQRGDLIGFLGNSGRSTGPHLHYEVHKLNEIVNPVDYFLPTDTMVD